MALLLSTSLQKKFLPMVGDILLTSIAFNTIGLNIVTWITFLNTFPKFIITKSLAKDFWEKPPTHNYVAAELNARKQNFGGGF